MLPRASSRLAIASCSLARQLATSSRALEGQLASNSEFTGKVNDHLNIEACFPADFLKNVTVGPSDGPTPSKLKLTFVSPHKILMSNAEVCPWNWVEAEHLG